MLQTPAVVATCDTKLSCECVLAFVRSGVPDARSKSTGPNTSGSIARFARLRPMPQTPAADPPARHGRPLV